MSTPTTTSGRPVSPPRRPLTPSVGSPSPHVLSRPSSGKKHVVHPNYLGSAKPLPAYMSHTATSQLRDKSKERKQSNSDLLNNNNNNGSSKALFRREHSAVSSTVSSRKSHVGFGEAAAPDEVVRFVVNDRGRRSLRDVHSNRSTLDPHSLMPKQNTSAVTGAGASSTTSNVDGASPQRPRERSGGRKVFSELRDQGELSNSSISKFLRSASAPNDNAHQRRHFSGFNAPSKEHGNRARRRDPRSHDSSRAAASLSRRGSEAPDASVPQPVQPRSVSVPAQSLIDMIKKSTPDTRRSGRRRIIRAPCTEEQHFTPSFRRCDSAPRCNDVFGVEARRAASGSVPGVVHATPVTSEFRRPVIRVNPVAMRDSVKLTDAVVREDALREHRSASMGRRHHIDPTAFEPQALPPHRVLGRRRVECRATELATGAGLLPTEVVRPSQKTQVPQRRNSHVSLY